MGLQVTSKGQSCLRGLQLSYPSNVDNHTVDFAQHPHLGGKRLVDLKHIDIVQREPCLGHSSRDGHSRADAHDGGVHTHLRTHLPGAVNCASVNPRTHTYRLGS